MATFKERFNMLFDESELSQEEFGKKFNASKGQVYNWRSGRGEPDSETMKQIALSCAVSLSWLHGETDERKRIQDLSIPSIQQFFDERIKETLNEEEKNAFEEIKKLPLKEQQNFLVNIAMKLYKLPEKDRDAVVRVINSYVPSQQ